MFLRAQSSPCGSPRPDALLRYVIGADAGFIAASAALASGKADCVLVPEEDFDPWKTAEYIADRARKQHYTLVVVAEGALLTLGKYLVSHLGYLIRAVPPGAEDLIAAARLGDLGVDGALSRYTGFMLSQWLTGHVLVPLPLVVNVKKRISRRGIFWREVASATGQPEFPR